LTIELTDNNSEAIIKEINLTFLSDEDFAARSQIKKIDIISSFDWTNSEFKKAKKLEYLNEKLVELDYSTNKLQSITTISTAENTPEALKVISLIELGNNVDLSII
jgi:hypothetical protein